MADTTISIKDVRYVAGLAHIAVSDDEATKLRDELDAILGYVRQLDLLDTSGVEPTYQVTGLKNVDREDIIIDYGVSQQALLQNAPNSQDNQIKVPKVL
jgi:aspartyl-tRNA(Asn)/glutamyl-tRNA(Gln) amidotransferase subunit C